MMNDRRDRWQHFEEHSIQHTTGRRPTEPNWNIVIVAAVILVGAAIAWVVGAL